MVGDQVVSSVMVMTLMEEVAAEAVSLVKVVAPPVVEAVTKVVVEVDLIRIKVRV